MIYGIGIDIQSISKMNRVLRRQQERFLQRVLTENEIAYCCNHRNTGQHFAARWAVKEAYFKALGTGIRGEYRFLDVEIVHLPSGQPSIILHGKTREDWERFGLNIFVSISHSGDYAIGQVILSHFVEQRN
jgi:holo-[acyl-carrier protein] synthase